MFKYRDDNRVGEQTTLSADDNLGGQLIANFVLWMLKYIDYNLVGQLTMYIVHYLQSPWDGVPWKTRTRNGVPREEVDKNKLFGKLGNF